MSLRNQTCGYSATDRRQGTAIGLSLFVCPLAVFLFQKKHMINIFKKKVKPIEDLPKRIDLDKYTLRLTVKSICLFEKLSGKSFYAFGADDVTTLMYAVFATSNNLQLKRSTFDFLIEDVRLAKWMGEKFGVIMDYISQFKETDNEDKGEGGEVNVTITDIADSLIIKYGVDAHYVMEEMELWQIPALFNAAEDLVKERYEENRLWTYLDMLPHIDGKKVNRPDKLLPFPWETQKKKTDAEQRLKENEYAVKHTIGKKIDYLKK